MKKLNPMRKFTARQRTKGMFLGPWHCGRTGEDLLRANPTPLRKIKTICTVKGY